MPQYSGNLIKNPGDSDLAGNYRRVHTGDSTFGTRRLQFYTIAVVGLTQDFVGNDLYGDDSRWLDQDTYTIDQDNIFEFTRASIVEAIIRGVQSMSELYIVGYFDTTTDGDYVDLAITVGVAASTVESHYEQVARGNLRNYNSDSLTNAVVRAVDDYNPQGGYEFVIVQAREMLGAGIYPYSGTSALSLAQPDPAKLAAWQATKAAMIAELPTPPESRRPG